MNDGDYVRAEIELALEGTVPILPVLVDNEAMPDHEQVPPSLREFCYLNAYPVDRYRHFHVDLGRVIQELDFTVLRRDAPRTLIGHRDHIECLTFSHSGEFLASGGSDSSVIVWQGPPGIASEFKGHRADVIAISFLDAESLLISYDMDGRLCVWDIPAGQKRRELKLNTDRSRAVVFAPDGRRLACGERNGRVSIWEIDSGQRVHLYRPKRWHASFWRTEAASISFSAGRKGRRMHAH